jgi:hypothetical protein
MIEQFVDGIIGRLEGVKHAYTRTRIRSRLARNVSRDIRPALDVYSDPSFVATVTTWGRGTGWTEIQYFLSGALHRRRNPPVRGRKQAGRERGVISSGPDLEGWSRPRLARAGPELLSQFGRLVAAEVCVELPTGACRRLAMERFDLVG